MKSKLEIEGDKCAVTNTLQIFVQEEVLRTISREKSYCPISVLTKVANNSADLNKNEAIFNGQLIKFQSEKNECEFGGDYNDVSLINSASGREQSEIALTNEECDIKYELLRRSENTALVKFERKSNESFGVSNISNNNGSDISRIEFAKEEIDLKPKIERSAFGDFAQNYFENKFDGQGNLPVASNIEGSVTSGIKSKKKELQMKKENSTPEALELETIENAGYGLNVAFQIANVCTVVTMEDCGDRDIRSKENALRSGDHNNKSTAAIINMQPNSPQLRKRNTRRPPTQESAQSESPQSDTEPHKYTFFNKKLTQSSDVIVHELTQNGARPHEYAVSKKFVTGNLTKPTCPHRANRPYKDSVSTKAFTQCDNLAKYERTHKRDRPSKCTVCLKVFTRFFDLTVHERKHNGDRPFKCTVCLKAFRYSNDLIVHKRINNDVKPYKCSIYNKAFRNSSNFAKHKRLHSGERPYKCNICEKRFKLSSGLTAHERTHSGTRPYACTVCNKTFTRPTSVTRHARVHSMYSNKL